MARDWMTEAACLDGDPGVFFPLGEEGSPGWERDVAAAKRVCAGCPVRAECLVYGVGQDVRQVLVRVAPEGVFGGLTPGERAPLVRARMGESEAA
jgi:WhiB family redox-sensing transcriptional regulator